jgi:hypothetical protein
MEAGDDTRRLYIVGGIAGFLLVALCCILAGVAAFGGLAYLGLQEPQNVDIQVAAPTTIQVGETFSIEVKIANRSNELQTLNSINISNDYLKGIEILRSTPTYVLRDNVTILGIEFQIFTFQENIFGGETLVIEFEANAAQAGDYAGGFDVCINSVALCKTLVTRTVVR